MTTCAEVMTADPTCCSPKETAARIATLMKSEDVGAIPVCTDRQSKQLVGIITDRDLALKVVGEGRDPAKTRAEDIMTRGPVACRASDDVLDLINTMETRRIRRVPVVDDKGRLVGIVAQADVAVRYGDPECTAEVVQQISQPNGKS